MAYINTSAHTGFDGLKSVLSSIGAFFVSVGSTITLASTMNGRVEHLRRLEAKTDAELAAMNLTREDLVHHVFRDLYYM
ncbi:hypothetical protein [Sulfitobacter sp.]|jgi:hypothetical protein|uniref:hypothetical protein n=1 Tax=Sulfitobacter sp. TaxID=1903071 RepID=UPI0035641934|tara:strand:+ start:1524 stop:1760 length:237 start_codon:yes stop_codon:yes gene_type:complete